MVWPAQQTAPLALTPQQLHHRCEPGQFHFEAIQELAGLTELIGQTRAMDAVRFGAGIQHDGYNHLPDEEKKRISAAIAELQPGSRRVRRTPVQMESRGSAGCSWLWPWRVPVCLSTWDSPVSATVSLRPPGAASVNTACSSRSARR